MSFAFAARAAVAAPTEPSAVRWEETACPLCDSERWTILLEAPDPLPGRGFWFAVVRCQNCSLCFTNPRPTPATIGQFYPTDYRPHQVQPWRKEGWRHRTRRPVPRIGPGRLLDFGCGNGAFLEEMHYQGWQATGIDVAESPVAHVRDRLGLHALHGTLPHPELLPGRFDVVTMWHSLEHVHQPRQVLQEVHRLLAPAGKLIVAVPNLDSLGFRWFGGSWFGLDLPRHLTHFTPWTLQVMLERAGFRVGSVSQVRHSSWLRGSARLASRRSTASRRERWLWSPLLSQGVSWYAHLTQQSDAMIVTAER